MYLSLKLFSAKETYDECDGMEAISLWFVSNINRTLNFTPWVIILFVFVCLQACAPKCFALSQARKSSNVRAGACTTSSQALVDLPKCFHLSVLYINLLLLTPIVEVLSTTKKKFVCHSLEMTTSLYMMHNLSQARFHFSTMEKSSNQWALPFNRIKIKWE